MQSKQYFTKIKNYPHEKSTEPFFIMQSKQYFTKIKNYPHEKSTEPKWRLEITMELQKNVMKAFMICMITKKARYLRTFVLFVLDLNQGPSD